jgi:hypothetical protein
MGEEEGIERKSRNQYKRLLMHKIFKETAELLKNVHNDTL